MTDIITHPTWEQLEKGAKLIAGQIRDYGWCELDYVVGLTRGGLVPAVVMSHVFDLPMIAVNYSSVHGKGDNRNHQNDLPAIYKDGITKGTGEAPVMPNLLIVDDICDSGKTMAEVYQYYSLQGHRVFTAALYYKEGAVIQPDFFWQKIPSNAPWIIFPFEEVAGFSEDA